MAPEKNATFKALIFDFDGLILDTEGPVYQSWQELYESLGCRLSFSRWASLIGTAEILFDPFTPLEGQLGHPVDRPALDRGRRARELDLIAAQPARPGVENYLADARRLGLKVGVASSSSREWVTGYLEQLGLRPYFDCIRAAQDVAVTKPDPALYLSALECLRVRADQAIAFEDSPNGILAAKRAGLFCVAVPNDLTRQLSLELSDLQLASLEDLALEQLLQRVNRNGKG